MKLHNTDLGILILRLSLGILMLFHGFAKLLNGVEGMAEKFSNTGIPGFIAYGVYVGEVIAPVLLIIGFRTRLAALLYSFTMLVAIVLAHTSDILATGPSGGWAIELPMMYLLGGIVLLFTGGGKYAVSHTRKRD